MEPPSVAGLLRQGHSALLVLEGQLLRWRRLVGRGPGFLTGQAPRAGPSFRLSLSMLPRSVNSTR